MAARWRDPGAFRATPSSAPALRPSLRQSGALVLALVLVAGAVAGVSYLVRPDHARTFALTQGSVFLADTLAPVSVDLVSGRPTVRLIDAGAQVGAKNAANLAVVPLDNGTLLLNRSTGEFNMVAPTGFVVKPTGGVPLPQGFRAGGGPTASAVGIPSGALAYIERTGPAGTSVYLVGQSTIETADNAGARAQPRAFRTLREPGSTDPGAASAANGDLFLLVGSGGIRSLKRLTLPANSRPGVELRSSDLGTVAGPAALTNATLTADGTAADDGSAADDGTAADDGSAGSVSALAASDRIRYFGTGAVDTSIAFPPIAGADTVLPTGNAQGRLSWLIRGTAGWFSVSLAADGRDLRGPTRLDGVPSRATLLPPVASRDELYTMDTSTGRIFRIGADGANPVVGASTYPLGRKNGRIVEAGGFGDAYGIARDSRVILNSPGHSDALVLFTDGSHPPLTVEKSSAVSVNAGGGADALTRSRTRTTSHPVKGPAKPRQQPGADVSNKINCRTARQKPHIPRIVGAVPGSRSVELTWDYPLLDPQDCAPSTYVLAVRLLSSSAPDPPAPRRLQGLSSVNLTGLFPSTQYEITVTAYINGQGTAAPARRITTGPEGPAAPSGVTAAPDAQGNWNVSWTSCGTTNQGCVPASSWRVVPEFCDGLALSGAPTPITVTADPTTRVQPPARLLGGDALLGRGVRFQVEGIGEQSTVGDPSGFTPCTYSWRAPNAAAISFDASTPGTTTFGRNADAIVTLHFDGDSAAASGGIGATYTYTLSGNGTTRTIGPTARTAARFNGGVAPGGTYTASVSVTPPRHQDATLGVGTQVVSTSSAWPAITLSDTKVTADPDDPSRGTLTMAVGGVTSRSSGGERFDFSGLTIRCQNTSVTLNPPNGFDPGAGEVSIPMSNIAPSLYNSPCDIGYALVESTGSRTSPPFYGGTVSKATTGTVQMPQQSADGLGNPSFTAQFAATPNSAGQSVLQLTASGLSDRLAFFTHDWSEIVTDGPTANCGSDTANRSTAIAVSRDCVQETDGSAAGWRVTITYQSWLDAGTHQQTIDVARDPGPPSYQAPCSVSIGNFSAAWSGTNANPSISLTYAKGSDQLGGCADWTYEVQPPETATACQTPDTQRGAPTDAPYSFGIQCSGAPPDGGWSVTVSFDGTAGARSGTVDVTGTPPQ